MKTLKILFVTAVISTAFVGCKPSGGFTITGEVENGVKVDTVEIYPDISFTNPIAYGVVKDNKFTITGPKVDTVRQVFIGSPQLAILNTIVLDNEKYTCKISRQNIIVRGGKIHEIVYGKMNDGEGAKLNQEYEDLMNRAEATDRNDLAAEDKIGKEMVEFGRKRADFYNAYTTSILEGNYPAEAKALALSLNSDEEKYPQEKRLEMIAEYEKILGVNHPLLREYREQVKFTQEQEKMAKTVAVGSHYKPVIAVDRDGKSVDLADVIAKNKYTLLEFWASWCGPCRAEIPNLKEAYEKYKTKGFEIYSVSIDSKTDDWIKALEKEQTKWINVVDTKGFSSEISRSYGINGIPAEFLISQDGVIVESNDNLRGEALDKLLGKLLNVKLIVKK